jgi:amidase/aspartyl-tRNA(Asn)/glutamyl-tRNA(Gln) amidotransferase subunit A
MSAEVFLIKLSEFSAAEQRAALCGLPDTKSLIQRFENAWELREQPLGGVPFLTKDLFFRAGHPTMAGSTFLNEEIGVSRHSSSLPQAFQNDAGAVECGRTQLNEFAYGLSGENSHFGDCPHPTHPELLSGGSSSGSAFAVARGLVPFALATDTAGSIRVPCGYCGTWGLRLTPELNTVGDTFPLSPGYDTQGWITRTAQDLITVSQAVLGKSASGSRGLWVGDLGSGVSENLLKQFEAFALAAGAHTDRAATELLRLSCVDAADAFPVLGGTAAARVHSAWQQRRKNDYDPVVWARLEQGRLRTADEIRDAESTRLKIQDAFRTVFKHYDFIAMPCTAGPAVSKAALSHEHRQQLLALNAPVSLAGLPVVVAPVRLENGLTAGMQFIFPDMNRFAWQTVLERFS